MTNTLLFVYNANSNPWSKLFDAVHKVVSPETYACGLCKLTHGVLKEKELWTTFRKQSASRMVFLYKDQFLKLHGVKNELFSFPIILQHSDGKYQPLITTKELRGFKKTEDLINFLQEQLKKKLPKSIKAAS